MCGLACLLDKRCHDYDHGYTYILYFLILVLGKFRTYIACTKFHLQLDTIRTIRDPCVRSHPSIRSCSNPPKPGSIAITNAAELIPHDLPPFIPNTWVAPQDIVRVNCTLYRQQAGVIRAPEGVLEVWFVKIGLRQCC
jgi:hypothetical protein